MRTRPDLEATPGLDGVAENGVCRFCGATLEHTFVDLGMSPLCEHYPSAEELGCGEMFYPLHTFVCGECLLVQLGVYESPGAIFSDYPYFSSYSESWLRHAENYCTQMTSRFSLGHGSLVVEIGSNDGYLLQYFRERDVGILGVDPAANVARVAEDNGVPTRVAFFGTEVAEDLVREGCHADLVVANNVLAQVPDLNGFVAGLRILLAPGGVLTLEFPHLLTLIKFNEFDTIYHEHFSYFSLGTALRILESHGLSVFDVEELQSHGGSLRVFASKKEATGREQMPSVERVLSAERSAGLDSLAGYVGFPKRVRDTRLSFMDFILAAAREEKTVAGYGAPGKSATLLNYCGIGPDLIEYVVDRNPHKQGRYLPGTHIPIYHPDRLRETCPDYVVILPWNLRDEVIDQLAYVREWGGRLVVPIPQTEIC